MIILILTINNSSLQKKTIDKCKDKLKSKFFTSCSRDNFFFEHWVESENHLSRKYHFH